MTKTLTAIFAVLTATATCHATLSFVGNSYAIVDANGGGDSYFDVSNQGNDNFNPNFAGQTFTISQGQTLLLGGQTQTFPQQFGTSAWMSYQLFQGATLITEVDNINLPFLQQVGNNDQWQQLASTGGINVDQNLAVNTYTLEVWFGGSNGNTLLDNNGGANYTATLSVIPEPIYPALIGFAGLLGLVRLGRWVQSKHRFAPAA